MITSPFHGCDQCYHCQRVHAILTMLLLSLCLNLDGLEYDFSSSMSKPMMITLSGFRSGTLHRTSTSTSVSRAQYCPDDSLPLTHKINSVSASSCVLGMLTMFSREVRTPFWVCAVISTFHNRTAVQHKIDFGSLNAQK